MTGPGEPDVTFELAAAHGLNLAEYDKILALTGRTPTYTELGIFSAMWNEHCSYKSTKKWLRILPTNGPCVIQGPGENAGVVDIGDGQAVVFKMESHNHPSFIEPFQGAATGMGGILRDIFTMGARPIAAMNALRFGAPEHEKTPHLVAGVVAGIGAYANCFGVATVGGEVEFDQSYNGNILVNAFAAGLVATDAIFYSAAKGVGLPIVYLGAKTGRDGVGGATMASAEFGADIEEKRPTVQVGDPFTEKRLLEACLELMATGAVIAIQDMGAAGLTCSAVEMGARGDLGIELDLDAVPVRETDMTPYEMMLSESQERMLMVLAPEKEDIARKIFQKWELDFATVGKTTNNLRFRVVFGGREVANLPIRELGDQAPEYDRPWNPPPKPPPLGPLDLSGIDMADALLKLLGSPNLCSRRWVYEQYDTLIGANSLQTPGGDAGVVRVEGHPAKALAFSSDVTPRYCAADPYEGAMQAVAECWRNLCATGATPLAASDNLNFGNPEKPEIMGQIVGAIKGIARACTALNFPIVSGNVSLYNETSGTGISPTPTIAGVGLISDFSKMARIRFARSDEVILLVGAPATWGTHLGQSRFLHEIFGQKSGPPPPVDLGREKAAGELVRALISARLATAVHDCSDGGLAVALAEMAMAGNIGATVDFPGNGQSAAVFFGEDQARYVLTIAPADLEKVQAMAKTANISAPMIGRTGGNALKLGSARAILLSELNKVHSGWFDRFMNARTE
ncbi:MAG: phosphoribosylformylglycinamidine synthase subunit PurL [Alphaproteobacteria bacterium]|nr:phosphoribosylformylglycinamidine synthase subunit PurL [Alphaproteobacteria bacterium]